jgi:hypothetical protein
VLRWRAHHYDVPLKDGGHGARCAFAHPTACGFVPRRVLRGRPFPTRANLRELPDDGRSDAFVIVSDHVTDAGNFLPGNFRVTRFQVIGEMAAGLRNNLNAAFDEPLPLPVILERFERYIFQNAMDAFDRLDDIS